MFSQSGDFSQTSNGDYNFLHNASQNSSQFEFDGMLNKNQNNMEAGELGIINEENPLSPMKINYNESKKSLLNNQNISKSSKYSFGIVNNNNQNNTKLNIICDTSNNENGQINQTQKNINPGNNKENISNNIDETKNTENNTNVFQLNIDNYKCQLSQQIDQVQKIASQSMSNMENNQNFNKFNSNKDNLDSNKNNNNNYSFVMNNNNISEGDIVEHQRFNKYCADLIDNAMNKNLEYIDNIKNTFDNALDTYKMKFKTNAEAIKKLILLYSDDVFQKEQNKIIISNLTDQLLAHINSFFQEMNKYHNFKLNSNNNNENP